MTQSQWASDLSTICTTTPSQLGLARPAGALLTLIAGTQLNQTSPGQLGLRSQSNVFPGPNKPGNIKMLSPFTHP